MIRRKFKIHDRLSATGGIIDIPHLAFLKYTTLPLLIEDHIKMWGEKPDALCIPVSGPDGLNLRVDGIGLQQSTYSNSEFGGIEFGAVISEASDLGLDLYLLLDPTLTYCNIDALHISDIVGDSSSSICIANPRSQELLGAILGAAIDEAIISTSNGIGKLKGVVFDTVNLWPMSANNERIALTCFCSSCEKYFTLRNPGLIEKFKTFPNPVNLLLQDSGTGISHIHDFEDNSSEEYIIGLCKQKGFERAFKGDSEATLRAHASDLLAYVRLRHQQTLESISLVFQEALSGLDLAISKVILCEGFTYNWTSGILLRSIDNTPSSICDEVWFDPQQSDLYLTNKPFKSYMWRRSRYYIDAFLTFAGNVSSSDKRATTGIARLSKEAAREMLRKRFSQAIGASLKERSALASLPSLASTNEGSTRNGFVGVAMNNLVGLKFIDGIDIPSGLDEDSSDIRKSLLEQLRSAMQQNA